MTALGRAGSFDSILNLVGETAESDLPAAPNIADIIELVEGRSVDRFQQRGPLLMRHMRLCKEKRMFERLSSSGVQRRLGQLPIQ
eukprot:11294054-Alexandrium_andersonii.AAC.1